MKTKINTLYPHHVVSDYNSDIYIADYTEKTKSDPIKKGVDVNNIKHTDIESFLVGNKNAIPFSTVKFDNKSFVDATTHKALSQCECICFSSAEYSKGPWILLLELKYCGLYSKYKKEKMEEAKNQLIDTFKYYKDNGILNHKQQYYLVISFPLLSPPFLNFTTTQEEVKKMKLKRVIFRCVNELKIKCEFKLEV